MLAAALIGSLCACSKGTKSGSTTAANASAAAIEEALNLANNENQEWTYDSSADAWVLSVVTAVTNPEIEDQQGVSVCVPGAYVKGIDTDADGSADVTADSASEAINGSLVIDYDAEITSTNGQVYTASTCPVILNTGAAGYGSSTNTTAATTYAKEGYINVACGNRGKQDTATDSDGNEYYTGDAPSCLVDQKNATRYVKYNILLGNLPGNVDYFVSTGGSGGGPGGNGSPPSGDMGGTPPDMDSSSDSDRSFDNAAVAENSSGDTMDVGTPDAGSTQSASGSTDSANYSSFDEMLEAYQSDIAEIQTGDEYGNNIVDLYNPLNYIGDDDTDSPTWTRILMGASEGDMSMFSSLNLQIAWLNAGVDSIIEWQWDGGHVPSEILGDSLALYVDEMYGKYVDGAVAVTKPEATKQTENGDSTEASGTDLTSWVNFADSKVSFSLADAASYRTAGASKAVPGFDVIDYGQEDYVFGSSTADARHWDAHLLKVLEDNNAELSALFNQ